MKYAHHTLTAKNKAKTNRNAFKVFFMTFRPAVPNVPFHGLNIYLPQTKLREGNVFAGVCPSFCPQGRGVGTSHASWDRSHGTVPL